MACAIPFATSKEIDGWRKGCPLLVSGRIRSSRALIYAVVLVTLAASVERAFGQTIQDHARVEGIRGQQLSGMGLVIGLAGSGDSRTNELTQLLYRGHVENTLGVDLPDIEIRSKNVALVKVTATVNSWTKAGSEIEVSVASLGDAKSLEGGTLIETNLLRPRRSAGEQFAHPFALAQGPVAIAPGGVATTGVAVATLEADISFPLTTPNLDEFRIILNEPDFSTAAHLARTINSAPYLRAVAAKELPLAHAVDLGTIHVRVPAAFRDRERVIDFISKIMTEIPVADLDPEAKVVIDVESGGVSINGAVRVLPVSVIYGDYEIRIGLPDDPAGAKPRIRTGAQPLVDIVWGLENAGLEKQDFPKIIKLIHDAGALQGKLVER